MSKNRKLTKFPVIAEDGTEYRVTIKNDDDYIGYFGTPTVVCRLYIPRKRFGHRLLYCARYYARPNSVYDADNPDYVAIARQVYSDWLDENDRNLDREFEDMAQAQRKSAAIDAFQAWDGRL